MNWDPVSSLPPLDLTHSVGPSAIARLPEHLDVFVVDDHGFVQSTYKADGEPWAHWFQIGTTQLPPGTPITAVARHANAIDLFAVNGAGAVLTARWAGGIWTDWTAIGGSRFPVGAWVTAVARRPDHLDLFAVETGGLLVSAWWHGDSAAAPGAWSSFFPIPGESLRPGASVAAVARTPEHLDVFAITTDGAAVSTGWHGDGIWAPWFTIDGGSFSPTAALAVVAREADHLDLFGVTIEGHLVSTWWHKDVSHGDRQWAAWFAIGERTFLPPGRAAEVRVLACSRQRDWLDVFAVGEQHQLLTSSWGHGSAWSPWVPTNIGITASKQVAAVARRPGLVPPVGPASADTDPAHNGRLDVFAISSRPSGHALLQTGNQLPRAAQVNNWAKTITISTNRYEEPQNTLAVRNVVLSAISYQCRVRAIGSAWSFSDVVDNDAILLSLRKMNGVLGLSQGTTKFRGSSRVLTDALTDDVLGSSQRLAHVQAGIRIKELIEILDKADNEPSDSSRDRWALPTMGGSGGQTLAGLLSTGSHGANFRTRPLADFVMAVEIVDSLGVIHWIERASAPITTAARLDAAHELRDIRPVYDDGTFHAALTSLGTLGVITGYVIAVDAQSGISQRVARTTWSAVRPLLVGAHDTPSALFTGGPSGRDSTLGLLHPATLLDGTNAGCAITDVEVFVNPYRIADDYGETAAADRDCWVTSKATAAAGMFDNFARRGDAYEQPDTRSDLEKFWDVFRWAVDPVGALIDEVTHGVLSPAHAVIRRLIEHDWIGAAIDPGTLNLIKLLIEHSGGPRFDTAQLTQIVSAELGGPGTVKDQINRIMGALRFNTRGYAPRGQVLDTYDYTADPLPILSMEFAITTEGDRHIALLDDLLATFDRLIREHRGTYLGGWSLRFTRRTRALLGLAGHAADSLKPDHNAASRTDDLIAPAAQPQVCHIEVFAIKEFRLPDFQNDGNMEGASDLFMRTFEDLACAHGARLHLGQLNRLTGRKVQVSWGPAATIFRRERTAFNSAQSQIFSNRASERLHLESNSLHVLVIAKPSGPVAVWYKKGGHLTVLDLDQPTARRTVFNALNRDGKQFVGKITGKALPDGSLAIFGWGNDGDLYRVDLTGADAHWTNMRLVGAGTSSGRDCSEPSSCIALEPGGIRLVWRFRAPEGADAASSHVESVTGSSAAGWMSDVYSLGSRAPELDELTSAIGPDGMTHAFGFAVGPASRSTPIVHVEFIPADLIGPNRIAAQGLSLGTSEEDVAFAQRASGALVAVAYGRLVPGMRNLRANLDLIAPTVDGDLLICKIHDIAELRRTAKISWTRVRTSFPRSARAWLRSAIWSRELIDPPETYQLVRELDPVDRFAGSISADSDPRGGYDLVGRGINGDLLRAHQDANGGYCWMRYRESPETGKVELEWKIRDTPHEELVLSSHASVANEHVLSCVRNTRGELRIRNEVGSLGGEWTNLAGDLSAPPSVIGRDGGRVDVFVRSSTGSLACRRGDGLVFSDWEELGGVLTSPPFALAIGTDRVDVYVRNMDDGVHCRRWNGSSWEPWLELGGACISQPTAASWGPTHADLFILDAAREIQHRRWDGHRWSDWQSLGGPFTSRPVSASWGPNHIDLFGRGFDGTLQHRRWNGTRWLEWQSLGGVIGSPPTAASWGANHMDVFACTIDGSLKSCRWRGSSWGPWEPMGGEFISAPIAISMRTGHVDVLAIDPTHRLQRKRWLNEQWGEWERICHFAVV